MTQKLTHFNDQGRAQMVDVSAKSVTHRLAKAKGSLKISAELAQILEQGSLAKGDAFTVAKTAGILAAKQTGLLIPLCHPLGLDQVEIEIWLDVPEGRVYFEATAKCEGKTGVEMEALTALSVAALTVYDMCKAVDKGMVIERIGLALKEGGKSGRFENPDFL
ncbi:MAG: molybdenum cofactor biosynthesis protein C [Candidatus Lambdaproteobacteria bacterium RIFOXYD1_FULL_56_27]|uniref:Cyclic pyranopterin monophosphate synthase n=1 Tax=Candidatus Lambdaproteobacteria bacterium RIFOXYD2_FULL_56_26 TaxID=1817773 RepID=A0A1F6H2M0_9PROT|nr:MAG: molybdenum cofactor biosynthesis protein C [Candidatus Lambdaproteobacteria bacterium RIFOXYC1_FULL_56_13]OGH04647.1 MAG: molybdenum cofactor biosynthesis protein C [Candidatus Lambdaproteobacteria bacterium RIFOXYD2_FULL_56_26]OGH09111.1 MAG: molybdenum cofactor biosynthesis protein C [Candidatus Lambdaproteobacteria bacterium RIFOXYD1_FULL_56_27]